MKERKNQNKENRIKVKEGRSKEEVIRRLLEDAGGVWVPGPREVVIPMPSGSGPVCQQAHDN